MRLWGHTETGGGLLQRGMRKFERVTEYIYYLDCGDVFMGVFQVKNCTCAVYYLSIKHQQSCKYYFYTPTSQIHQFNLIKGMLVLVI